MEFSGKTAKVVLVTGGSRGLGRAICRKLSENGHIIIANFRSPRKEADLIINEMGATGAALAADVGNAREVSEMLSEIQKRFGRLDAVVNNAGVSRDRLLVNQTESEWDEIMRTNLTGCFHVIRASAPLLAQSGGGHILNISSRSGLLGSPGQAAYSASKAALLGLTMTVARELAPDRIRVNALLPGYLPTEMGGESASAMDKARETSIMKTLSSLDEAASFVTYLLATEHITGQVFSLDSRIT